MVLLDVLRRRRRALLAVGVLRRRGACPLVGARQAVLLLVVRVLVGGHVGARLLRRRGREGGVHLGGSAGGQAGYDGSRQAVAGRTAGQDPGRVLTDNR